MDNQVIKITYQAIVSMGSGIIAQESGKAAIATRLGLREAFQCWLRACREFEEAKRCEQTDAERQRLLQDAERRINSAADAYTQALYTFNTSACGPGSVL